MGAAQRKEASAYFTQALSAATPPDADGFLAKVKEFECHLCGGSELSGVAQPIAIATLNAGAAITTSAPDATVAHRGQLRWLLQLCTKALRGVLGNPNETVDATTPALLHLTELLLRHVLRLTKAQSAALVAILESGGCEQEAVGGESSARAANAATSSSNDYLKEDAAASLCETCFTVLIHVRVSQSTVMLHLEVLRLLLTMTSTALHHSTEFCEDTMDLFTELMISSPQLSKLLDALLRVVVDWGKSEWCTQAPLLYHEGCQPSIRNFFQVFGGSTGGATGRLGKSSVPYVLEVEMSYGASPAHPASGESTGGAGSTGGPKNPASVLRSSCSCWEQLGRHAAALLCVLVIHQKGGGRNPALEYIAAIRDGEPVTYVQLLSAVRWKIATFPEISILMYVLLHDHQQFLRVVLSQDAALLLSTVQRLLEVTYRTCKDTTRPGPWTSSGNGSTTAAGTVLTPAEDPLQPAVLGRLVYHHRTFSYPFINFMSSTLLLLITQDCVVDRLMCNTPCLPGHLLERYDVNAPVGALAIVVLTLGITKGLNERNEALISVFAPCFVNLAPYLHDMDSYAAQRVAGLLTLVLKKIHRSSALLKAATAAGTPKAGEQTRSPPSSSASGVPSAEEVTALEEMLAMFLRQLRTIVEGVEALLRGAHRRNESLIYELLYSRDKIIDEVEAAVAAGIPSAVPTKQLLAGIVEMIKNCEADIASADVGQSPQEIIDILRRGQHQGSGAVDKDEGADGSNKDKSLQEAMRVPGGAGALGGAGNGSPSVAVSSTGAPHSHGLDRRGPDRASIDLVYSYEESPHSYDFFGPFIWSTLLSAARAPGAALWCHRSSELALFPH
ncbi:hypothetical protein ABL78_3053 [Leptomonas seymouri]|uniref:Dymeclin n=1 Tax=Leptomonas seymouri TaxID=5684 RepID=A0A0N0P6M9_LEPSE|nr:hypothetical protein ABL78_3053 [Leptomonas seymouri]|eukprot:KPI87826.1 hypothetical protein ABL78_3053 [Leptomonas seymouri]